MNQPPADQPNTTTPKLTLGERIEQEASKRAKRYAEDFDLMDCVPFEDLGFNGEEEIQIYGKYVSRGEIITTIDELNAAIGRFLAAQLPAKIAERLRKEILSGEKPEIDVTQLEG